MKGIDILAKFGLAALLATLLSVYMGMDVSAASSTITNLEFASAMLDTWAFPLVALGALLAMAMIGASYLARDERLENLLWEVEGGEEE